MIKKTFFISILILFYCTAYSQTDQWYFAGNMATPVAEGELIFYQSQMYLLGGYSESRQSVINSIQKYDFQNDTWEDIGTMVEPRRSFISVVTGGALFTVGGTIQGSANANTVELYNVIYKNPSEIFNRNSYFNRRYASGVLLGRMCFVVGGNPENINFTANYPYIYRYDISNEGATPVAVESQMYALGKLPEQQMVEIYKDEIYIFGGILNGVSRDIYRYRINDGTLVKLDIKLIEPRAAGKAIRLADENIILIIGGYNESNETLSSMEIFRAESDDYRIWSGPNLNVARKDFMVSQYSHKIFAMGGYNDRGNVLSSIEIFEPNVTDIEKEISLPEQAVLSQNYPNPFNPTTEINFSLSEYSNVTLDVYSSLGEHIRCLKSGSFSPGNYSVSWNSKTSEGIMVPSGIYFYILTTDKREYAKKMVLLK